MTQTYHFTYSLLCEHPNLHVTQKTEKRYLRNIIVEVSPLDDGYVTALSRVKNYIETRETYTGNTENYNISVLWMDIINKVKRELC